MSHTSSAFLMRFCALSLMLLLFNSACSLNPFQSSNNSSAQTQQTQLDVVARQSAARGDSLGAAQEYLRLAAQVQPPQRDEYWMTAIEYLLRGKHVLEAKAQLAALQSQQPQVRGRMQLAYAQIALLEDKPDNALALLQQMRVEALVPRSQISYYYLQALTHDAQKNTVAALYARVTMDALLGDAYALSANHDSIWQTLMGMTPSQLQQLPKPAPAALSGWTALALLAHTNMPNQLVQGIQNWRTQYPNHPAEQDIVINLLAGNTYSNPNTTAANATARIGALSNIALLLPLTSKFKEPAEMVRDGFISAWYSDSRNAKPTVKMYDADDNNVVAVYQQALQQGAQMVVGPMGKNAATALVKAYADFPIPTLLLFELDELNSPGVRIPKNLFQFSLSPESEARSVAEKAWSDGHRLAAIIAPEGLWGNRVQQAFATQWERLGGQVVSNHQYSQKDVTGVASQAANSSAEVYLLASFPTQARRIKPQLNYHGKGNTLLYATSHLYNAEVEPKQDKDLDGVRFLDMPWVLLKGFAPDVAQQQTTQATEAQWLQPEASPLYNSLQSQWAQRMYGSNKRLFAFGIDTYYVISYLQTATYNRGRDLRLKGATGLLSLDQRGVVQRQLLWATFRNGTVQLLPESSLSAEPASYQPPANAAY